MPLKFFSRLFGGGEEEAPEQQSPPERQSAPERQLQPTPKSPEPEKPAPVQLQLTQGHALHKLWKLRSEQAGNLPAPVLALEVPEDCPQVLPRADAERELGRLRVTVTTTAANRLTAATPKPSKKKTQEEEEEPPPAPVLDAMVQVYLSRDKLAAWVLIYPPVGEGKELDREMLDQALDESGVSMGVDTQRMDALPGSPDRYFHLWLIAWGKPPKNGKDGFVVDLFPRVQEYHIKVDQYGRADYTSLDYFHNVEKDAPICRIIAPTQGEPGCTVLDEEIPAKDGRPATVPKGRNTYLNEEGDALLASITGHVEFTNRSFQVKPVLEVPGSVDYSTGNINFLGDVHIHGDVRTGFSVRATGNITVDGMVECCVVEAGGNLTVAKGIVGDDQAVIRAQKNIFTKFLENSCACAREGLQADSIINSDVYSNGAVVVRTGRGVIVGGRTVAGKEISANVIGSRAELRTVITLGGLPCEEFEQDVLRREIERMETEMKEVEQQPESSSRLSRLSTLRMKLSINRHKLELLDKDLEEFRDSDQEQQPGQLKCDEAYGGTEITIGSVVTRLNRTMAPCNAALVNGEICIT